MKEYSNMNNSIVELKRHCVVACEFCDKQFSNRYDSIIHNASHIIIPLMRGLNHCEECHLHFESKHDFNIHMTFRHPKLPKVEIPRMDFGFDIKSDNSEMFIEPIVTIKYESNEDITIKEQKPLILHPPINNNIVMKTETKNEKSKPTDCVSNKIEETCCSIKNRLLFEGDDILSDSNGILKDFTTECKVNVPIIHPLVSAASKNKFTKRINNVIIITSNQNNIGNKNGLNRKYSDGWDEAVDKFEFDNFVVPDLTVPIALRRELKYNSIHYSQLKQPGIFNCKYCKNSFPNRYSLILHETSHIKITKGRPLLCTICDKYIAGNHWNLTRHADKEHPWSNTMKKKPRHTHKCQRCGLRFRKYKRHVKAYHKLDCHGCGKEINDRNVHDEHMKICPSLSEDKIVRNKKEKLVKVCDLCYSFFKHKINLKYVLMGTLNELGQRYTCEMCGKNYFELKLVRRIYKDFKFQGPHLKKKLPSNMDRLKNIQQRLKNIKLMNKY